MLKLFAVLFGLLFVPMNVIAGEVNSIDLVKAIEKEFAEQGIANMVELEIFGGKTDFAFDDAKDVKILISDLKADDNNKFTTNAEIFADGVSVGKTDLLGRFFVMKEIYVPTRDIAKDEVITSDALKTVLVRENRLKEDGLVDVDDIVGKQAIRLLKAEKNISKRDLRNEIVVKKGQALTIIYRNKGLQITSKMEALEDGAKGDLVKFINTKSAKEVVAKVIDKNTAEVLAE
ncbi:MAG: flagellar basal body P-ring formation protein FlgA [Alphaproteobacteria bacterium]|nr:flagellar basal body P-ring formation protein FlgA [Alphaproteobacteria bacterium]